MSSSQKSIFPEKYALGQRPLVFKAIDKERDSFPTPAYGYGWVISCTELFEGLDKNPCHESRRLEEVIEIAESLFKSAWTMNGYDNNNYSPRIRHLIRSGEDYVLICIACNNSLEMMDDIMANKKYHNLCREILGNSETLKLDPAWYCVDILIPPKIVFIRRAIRFWDDTLLFTLSWILMQVLAYIILHG